MNRPNRIRLPLISPTTAASTTHSTSPTAISPGEDSSVTQNDATTTRNPASGPTERSIPPISSGIVCPSAMKPSAVTSVSIDAMLKSER